MIKKGPFWWSIALLALSGAAALFAVEIPLDSLVPVRIGYVDLQKVFDTYPEKSFAEGDLLREIEKRRRELGQRQSDINIVRGQITADEAVLADAKKGQPVMVPLNNVPDLEPVKPAPAQTPAASTTTVKASSTTVEAYPTEDPLAGLPGHEGLLSGNPNAGAAPTLPGMKDTSKKQTLLDLLAAATGPMQLTPEATTALEKRVNDNKNTLARLEMNFRTFRQNAVADMKVLQNQKTYGVMAKIYAVLQTLARDENIMVVLDKNYVLYGEDSVDLSDKLIERLQGGAQG
jgi:Skp family chaperone for outer membrane proteins